MGGDPQSYSPYRQVAFYAVTGLGRLQLLYLFLDSLLQFIVFDLCLCE